VAPPPRVVVHSAGVEQLLKSPALLVLLTGMGRSIASAAGAGVEVVPDVGPNRVRVEVRTATFDAMRREAKNRTLSGALDAGRR
jgi:hypothetical protein